MAIRLKRLSFSSLSSSSTPSSSPKVWNAKETDETRALEMVLLDPVVRQELVDELLATGTDDSLKVRFVALYNEYRQGGYDPKKGRKLVDTFFRPGRFQFRSYTEEDMACIYVSNLAMAKTCILQELTQVPLVMKLIQD